MNHPEPRITVELAPEVFERASRLYAQHSETYSLSELTEAGAVARIPPEFIHKAVKQVQAEQIQARQGLEALKDVVFTSLIITTLFGWMAFGNPCHATISQLNSQTTQVK
ncbi:MAG: hypothetical protein KI793_06535 [Rivularia sp. (in: Bacteria)]|nr:hypothetical protein [Rivularia sp. MS3]